MSVERETYEQRVEEGRSPQMEEPNSSNPRHHSSSRLSAQATPWYPTQRVRDSVSSQPRREDEFPGTPTDQAGDGGVSPPFRGPSMTAEAAASVSRATRTGTPSSTSSHMASPILGASGARAYATDADDNVVLVPFHGYETEDEIIRGLAGDGYWWTPNNVMTAQQCHEYHQQQEAQLEHQRRLQLGIPKKKKMRRTRVTGDGADNGDDDDAEDVDDFGDEESVEDAGDGGLDGGGDDGWEDDPDAYADEWDSLDEDEQAWIEEQMRPQENPEGFF